MSFSINSSLSPTTSSESPLPVEGERQKKQSSSSKKTYTILTDAAYTTLCQKMTKLQQKPSRTPEDDVEILKLRLTEMSSCYQIKKDLTKEQSKQIEALKDQLSLKNDELYETSAAFSDTREQGDVLYQENRKLHKLNENLERSNKDLQKNLKRKGDELTAAKESNKRQKLDHKHTLATLQDQTTSQLQDKDKRIGELAAKLNELIKEKDLLQKQKQEAISKSAELQLEKGLFQTQIANIEAQRQRANKTIIELQMQIATLQRGLSEKEQLKTEVEQLKQQIKALQGALDIQKQLYGQLNQCVSLMVESCSIAANVQQQISVVQAMSSNSSKQ